MRSERIVLPLDDPRIRYFTTEAEDFALADDFALVGVLHRDKPFPEVLLKISLFIFLKIFRQVKFLQKFGVILLNSFPFGFPLFSHRILTISH
jgi:hypothetical protein